MIVTGRASLAAPRISTPWTLARARRLVRVTSGTVATCSLATVSTNSDDHASVLAEELRRVRERTDKMQRDLQAHSATVRAHSQLLAPMVRAKNALYILKHTTAWHVSSARRKDVHERVLYAIRALKARDGDGDGDGPQLQLQLIGVDKDALLAVLEYLADEFTDDGERQDAMRVVAYPAADMAVFACATLSAALWVEPHERAMQHMVVEVVLACMEADGVDVSDLRRELEVARCAHQA